jgi:hypothetical protein
MVTHPVSCRRAAGCFWETLGAQHVVCGVRCRRLRAAVLGVPRPVSPCVCADALARHAAARRPAPDGAHRPRVGVMRGVLTESPVVRTLLCCWQEDYSPAANQQHGSRGLGDVRCSARHPADWARLLRLVSQECATKSGSASLSLRLVGCCMCFFSVRLVLIGDSALAAGVCCSHLLVFSTTTSSGA